MVCGQVGVFSLVSDTAAGREVVQEADAREELAAVSGAPLPRATVWGDGVDGRPEGVDLFEAVNELGMALEDFGLDAAGAMTVRVVLPGPFGGKVSQVAGILHAAGVLRPCRTLRRCRILRRCRNSAGCKNSAV